MNKKYEFTGETKIYEGRTLHRIRRIEDGLVGGWLESERNLSHEGNCFVYDNAMAFDETMVCGNAKICGNAIVFGCATVYDNAKVYDDAWIYGKAEVFCNAKIYGDTEVYNNARIYDDAEICDGAKVYGDAEIYGNARVRDCARVYGSARVHKGEIIGQISQPYKDIFQCRCKNRILTAILTEDNEILYTIGCQNNITKKQFLDRIYNKDGGLEENPHREEYLRLIPAIEQYFKN